MLIAGDISNAKYRDLFEEKDFLYGKFTDWLSNAPHTIIVGGNHDFYIEYNLKGLQLSLPCEILENTSTEFRGVKIFGTPYSLEYCDWAYQATETGRQYQPDDMIQLQDIFSLECARKVDIVLSHGPPRGIGDPGYNLQKLGSMSLLHYIETEKPKLVLCGHIHEGFGKYTYDNTTILNCSYVNTRRLPRYSYFVVDFDECRKEVIDVKFVAED